MYSLLLTRRWLLSLVLAIAFAVVSVLLGNWQFGKHQDRLERRDIINANYAMDPVPLNSVLTSPGQPLNATQEWTRVQVSGAYSDGERLLVRNRPYRGVFGYEVLVPFEVQRAARDAASDDPDDTQGPLLLIDRGWVPNADSAATLPNVPAAPRGQVTVTGWLRFGEDDLGRDLPAGQVASINLPTAQQALGPPLYDAYLLLEDESPAPAAQRPAPADLPDTGTGVHLAYALQWWLTAPVGLILVGVMARREWREEHAPTGGVAAEPAAAGAPADPGALAPAGAATKPRKHRIWDDEDG